jgi:hypothetical protein
MRISATEIELDNHIHVGVADRVANRWVSRLQDVESRKNALEKCSYKTEQSESLAF